jgi:Transcription factor WhiB
MNQHPTAPLTATTRRGTRTTRVPPARSIARWIDRAACVTADAAIFFPEGHESDAEAKQHCAGCLVRDRCRDYALAAREEFGLRSALEMASRGWHVFPCATGTKRPVRRHAPVLPRARRRDRELSQSPWPAHRRPRPGRIRPRPRQPGRGLLLRQGQRGDTSAAASLDSQGTLPAATPGDVQPACHGRDRSGCPLRAGSAARGVGPGCRRQRGDAERHAQPGRVQPRPARRRRVPAWQRGHRFPG